MKYLLLDDNGHFYDNNGNKITIIESIANTIKVYGFELNELIELDNAVGKKMVALSSNNIKPSHSVISLNESFSQILILKHDLSQYKKLIFDNNYKIMTSSNGVDWRLYISKDHYIENKYNINLNSLNIKNLSDDEKYELQKFEKDLSRISKEVNNIECDGVKYIAFLLSPYKNFYKILSSICIDNARKRITNTKCIIDTVNNKISVVYSGLYNIKNLIVKITSKDVIKNTLKEI